MLRRKCRRVYWEANPAKVTFAIDTLCFKFKVTALMCVNRNITRKKSFQIILPSDVDIALASIRATESVLRRRRRRRRRRRALLSCQLPPLRAEGSKNTHSENNALVTLPAGQQYSTETEPSRQASFNYPPSRQPSFKAQNSSDGGQGMYKYKLN